MPSFFDKIPLIGLSPMDGITDEPFRLVQTRIAKPDLIFTEFVSAEGIAHGGLKLFDNLLYSPKERPIIAQLFGKDPDSFYQAAIILCHLGFDGIDINMGCPAKTVTQHGSGAALIAKPDLAVEIIKSVKSAISDYCSGKTKIADLKIKEKIEKVIDRNLKYSRLDPSTIRSRPSLSVKTRLGIDQSVITTWLPTILSTKLDFITLHGRTLKQGYSGLADWGEISKAAEIVHQLNTKIIGNGDIQTRQQGLDFCKKFNVDGILIGRSALGNPWAFSDITPTVSDKFNTAFLHAQIFLQVFPARRFEPLRRHFLAYASGLPHAKQLRQKLVLVNSLFEFQDLESDFLGC
ncbi:MAG: tRNA-dihydrouridine synthase family protein [Candidatus Shapirobacteria bacterium]